MKHVDSIFYIYCIMYQYGRSALMFASSEGHTNVLSVLISHGANVNFQDNNGLTALIKASIRGQNLCTVKLLVANGGDVNIQDNCGSTALYFAVDKKLVAVVRYFCENNAKINIRNRVSYNRHYIHF